MGFTSGFWPGAARVASAFRGRTAGPEQGASGKPASVSGDPKSGAASSRAADEGVEGDELAAVGVDVEGSADEIAVEVLFLGAALA
jgi:hypothetical protein